MGGYATSSDPYLWDPGTTDPRIRAFVVDWAGGWIGKPEIKAPPVADLDRVALMWFELVYDPWEGRWALDYAPVWADLSDSDRYMAALVWRQAFKLGALPEDELFETSPGGSPAVGWPSPDAGAEQRVYMWRFAGGTLYQHLQIQKWDGKAWRIFNKWGQNLTFVKVNGAWVSGWDLGDWAVQNRKALTDAIQAVSYAVFTLMSMGGGAAVAATGAAAMAAAKGAAAMMKSAIAGDVGGFVGDFLGVVGNVAAAGAAVHVDLGAEMRDALPEFVQKLPELPALKQVAVIVGDAAQTVGKVAPSLADVRAAVVRLGLPAPTDQEIRDTIARAIPEPLRVWATFGRRDAAAGQADDQIVAVPWYARGSYVIGATFGEQERAALARIRARVESEHAWAPATVRTVVPSSVALASQFLPRLFARMREPERSPSSPPVKASGPLPAAPSPVKASGPLPATFVFFVQTVAVGFLVAVSGVAAVRLRRR